MEETALPAYFGEWLKHRRKKLDLTQAELAERADCSLSALRKIEAGERHPSKQLAELLAKSLEIPSEDQIIFIRVARGELNVERLPSATSFHVTDHSLDQKPSTSQVNLPIQPTPFIGRETELVSLGRLLADPQCRLMTITGMGGVGKTRLAIKLAHQQQAKFPGGVYYVPLTSLNSPEFIVAAIAEAFRLTFSGSLTPQVQLLNHLVVRAQQAILLVLDNLEYLLNQSDAGNNLENAIVWLTEILRRAPNLKILATSRERISIQGEWTFELHGMPFPVGDQSRHLESYSAPALFMQRARQAKANFELLPDEWLPLTRICQLVEGNPLAIELAAAWIGLLSIDEIAQEIASNLDFMSTSMRDIPERHRSMRAVFDHSWQMLSTSEQQALSQLSVFQGGFQRLAAKQVADATLSVLSMLVNRSLLRRNSAGRYDLHELFRQYSAAQLTVDLQKYWATKKKHYNYFLALAEAADQGLKGDSQLESLGRLEQDHDNLRAALEWALESVGMMQGDEELALRLSGALRWFWRMRGHFHEGRGWLMEALQHCPEKPSVARARALLSLSLLLNGLGDLGAALPNAEESVAIYRELGDQTGLAEALIEAGQTLIWHGEAALGYTRLEEALTISGKADNRWGEAQALFRLGCFLADYGGDPKGRDMLVESATILEELGEKYLFVSVLTSLGIIDMGLGNYASARIHFERSLAVGREIRHPWGIADALTNLGCVFRIQGEYLTAQSLLEEAQRVYQEHGDSMWEADVLCALAENAIAQGNYFVAQSHLRVASKFLETSDNKWLQVLVFYFQGLLMKYEGETERAAELLHATTSLAREGQYKPDLARSLVTLGQVKLALGEILDAVELLREGLQLFQQLGHKLGIATAIEGLAAVSVAKEDWEHTVMLFSVAHSLREAIGAPLPPVDQHSYHSSLIASRARLGADAFSEAWSQASTRPLEASILDFMQSSSSHAQNSPTSLSFPE